MEASNALDQSTRITRTELQALDFVTELFDKAINEKDPEVLNKHIARIRRSQQIEGIALAKLLFLWKDKWREFEIGEEFEDYVFAEDGISPQTTRKYLALWEAIFQNPDISDEIKAALYGKPIQGLLLCVAASRENQLSDDNWEEIAQAPDTKTIREIIREIRGEQTSSATALIITLSRDGTLAARQGDEAYVPFGFLNPKPDNATAFNARDRIIRAAGVVEI